MVKPAAEHRRPQVDAATIEIFIDNRFLRLDGGLPDGQGANIWARAARPPVADPRRTNAALCAQQGLTTAAGPGLLTSNVRATDAEHVIQRSIGLASKIFATVDALVGRAPTEGGKFMARGPPLGGQGVRRFRSRRPAGARESVRTGPCSSSNADPCAGPRAAGVQAGAEHRATVMEDAAAAIPPAPRVARRPAARRKGAVRGDRRVARPQALAGGILGSSTRSWARTRLPVRSPEPRPVPVDPRFVERIGAWLRARRAVPRRGSGAEWLAQVARELGDEPDLREPLAELRRLAAEPRVRVVLCGDYNAGKSSLIKRLLVESGEVVPHKPARRCGPTTSSARTYEWEGALLVDTPGFQGERRDAGVAAHAAIADAAVVLYLFHVNLVIGDEGDLEAVLLATRARDPPQDRPGDLRDRSGGQAVRGPDDGRDAFRAQCVRKIDELITAIGALARRRGSCSPMTSTACCH